MNEEQGFVCCFCGRPIEQSDAAALRFAVTNLWSTHEAPVQALFAHSTCASDRMHADVIFDPDVLLDDADKLRQLEASAETAYAKMYDAGNPTEATARYSDAKEALADAIGLAQQLGQSELALRLEARLAHIKAVFRSQFS